MSSDKDPVRLQGTIPYLFILPLMIANLAENFIPTKLFPIIISTVIGTFFVCCQYLS